MLQLDYSLKDARRILKLLILCEAVMVGIYLGSHLLGNPSYGIRATFDLDGEACLPAWFTAVQLFVIGILLLVASRACHRQGPSPTFLKLVGAGFIYISADEAAMIHERAQGLLKYLKGLPNINGHGVWVFIYMAIGILILLASRRHLFSLWENFRQEMSVALVGLGIFLFSAVGLEIISYLFLRSGATPFIYVLEVALEEFGEMAGVSVMLYGVLQFVLQILQEKSWVPESAYTGVPAMDMIAMSASATEAVMLSAAVESSAVMVKMDGNPMVSATPEQ